jgi:hypothetical protein
MCLLTLLLLKPSDMEACSSHKGECEAMNQLLLLVLMHGDVTPPAVRISDILEAMIRLEYHIYSLPCLCPLTALLISSYTHILLLIVHLLYMYCTYCSVWGTAHGLSTTQPSTLLHSLPHTF